MEGCRGVPPPWIAVLQARDRPFGRVASQSNCLGRCQTPVEPVEGGDRNWWGWLPTFPALVWKQSPAPPNCCAQAGSLPFQTETVYGLGADATNGRAVAITRHPCAPASRRPERRAP